MDCSAAGVSLFHWNMQRNKPSSFLTLFRFMYLSLQLHNVALQLLIIPVSTGHRVRGLVAQ